ncbi:MAG TPA: patatin-like phospholipase family protein, partial [Nitrososphaera sp.]|nr:patatin-like phospholipase family protein [Nitrososphaera sp.]
MADAAGHATVPDKQRVLILQGGGSLGAYEAGVFRALSEELPKIDARRGEAGRPLFDIIAGTSIGAINAALLVSHYKENATWAGADKKLVDFWQAISSDITEQVDFWIHWWGEEHKNDPNAASPEAARRYYSAKYFLQNGTQAVFSQPEMVLDPKFYDNGSFPNSIWYRYDNSALRKRIQEFSSFPVATSLGDAQPRLLVVSTNVRDGATVTFDSYSKESEFGRYHKDSGRYEKRTIKYPRGVELRHVMASASVPLFYQFEDIEGEKFCDGGVLSNTPLREVLHAHRDYWYKEIGKNKAGSKVPDLEVYIIGVWPAEADARNGVPSDYDGMKERLYDINLSDKTEYDEKTAVIVSDYVDMIDRIKAIS